MLSKDRSNKRGHDRGDLGSFLFILFIVGLIFLIRWLFITTKKALAARRNAAATDI